MSEAGSSDGYDEMSCSQEDTSDPEEEIFDSEPIRQQTQTFTVLDASECLALAQKEVDEVRELLCCSEEVASILMRQFRWNREKLTEEYLCDADKVLKRAGIHQGENLEIVHADGAVAVGGTSQPRGSLPDVQCLICYETSADYSALGCGHQFCNTCYTTFLAHKITDEGYNCVFATCPKPECSLVVSERLVHSLALPADKRAIFDKARRIERSYVDDNPNLKWCTAAGCGNAIRAPKGHLGVKCSCGQRFCFKCNDEDHAPCSCEELAKWMVKCRDDSETYNWLMSNTKACPKCATSIEKNGGCNHMTCKNSSCKFEFCWVCLGPWKDHSGSYYSCNRYDPEKEKENPEAKKKDSSRAALERYLHYYTRFTNHHNSLKFEVEARAKMEEKIKEMEKQDDKMWIDCTYPPPPPPPHAHTHTRHPPRPSASRTGGSTAPT
mmetsp:Transcript_2911/g.9172  ORF Transcript_2911/g.9172 Transcript_2911/m.9172 type:complete len:439 (+) Transcript_2911:58-1374(+)